jgi:membrane protein DedA with SNARE-associated domain
MLFFPFQYWLAKCGYLAIYFLLTTGLFGLPVPDETLLTFLGYLASKKELLLIPTIGVAFLGSISGITISYLVGRLLGNLALKKAGRFLHISEKNLEKGELWFEKLGKWTLTFGYFIPGVRHIVAIIAGSTKLKIPIFVIYAYSGAFLWTATFVLLGYYLGEKWQPIIEKIQEHLLIASLVIVVLASIYFLIRKIKSNKKVKNDKL